MADFDKHSALFGIEWDDAESLRRVMNGVLHRLATVPAAQVVRQQGLNAIEEVIVEDIITMTENNELFRQIATRFASAHDTNTATVLRESRVFDTITPPSVRGTTSFPSQEAIDDARTAFRDFVENGLPFEYGLEEPDEATDQDVAMAEDDEPEGGEEDNLENEPKVKTSGNRVVLPLKRKRTENAPVMPKNTRIVDDGSSHDRRIRAEVNNENPSLLTLTFKAEMLDPEDNGPKTQRRWIPASPVVYDYLKIKPGFLWSSQRWIDRLNKWRYQILHRKLGAEGDSRWQWTVAEEELLYQLLNEHLPTVDGRYSQVNWGDVADRFNGQMRGRHFNQHDLTAVTQYKKGKETVVTASRPVATAHDFESRTAKALKTQLDKFTNDAARKILMESKKADKDAKKAARDHASRSRVGRPQSKPSNSNTANGKGKEPAQDIRESSVDAQGYENSSDSSLSLPPGSEAEVESEVEMDDDENEALQQALIDSTQEVHDDEALQEALVESHLDIDQDDDNEELQQVLKKSKREHEVADCNKKSGGESSNTHFVEYNFSLRGTEAIRTTLNPQPSENSSSNMTTIEEPQATDTSNSPTNMTILQDPQTAGNSEAALEDARATGNRSDKNKRKEEAGKQRKAPEIAKADEEVKFLNYEMAKVLAKMSFGSPVVTLASVAGVPTTLVARLRRLLMMPAMHKHLASQAMPYANAHGMYGVIPQAIRWGLSGLVGGWRRLAETGRLQRGLFETKMMRQSQVLFSPETSFEEAIANQTPQVEVSQSEDVRWSAMALLGPEQDLKLLLGPNLHEAELENLPLRLPREHGGSDIAITSCIEVVKQFLYAYSRAVGKLATRKAEFVDLWFRLFKNTPERLTIDGEGYITKLQFGAEEEDREQGEGNSGGWGSKDNAAAELPEGGYEYLPTAPAQPRASHPGAEVPCGIQEYIHYIGRTGRIRNMGLATSVYNSRDSDLGELLVMTILEVRQAILDFLRDSMPGG
ncbi:hypothetical protein BDZ45DRAFT_781238 [Acephala macrosclerotiorum]|nr:hypothetical protein BDZ45DRAFT_781238 [Acephala macrosclerotiorum]